MADLTFEIKLEWAGLGRDGQGCVQLGGQPVPYAAPESMGGSGLGTSPEELLLAAVSSCYSGTLYALLVRAELPVQKVQIRTEGIVTGYPLNGKFATLRVHPTIVGGDLARQRQYEDEARHARSRCFIGRTITGNVEYGVGEVQILPDPSFSS